MILTIAKINKESVTKGKKAISLPLLLIQDAWKMLVTPDGYTDLCSGRSIVREASNNLDYCFVPFRCVSKTLIVSVSQR